MNILKFASQDELFDKALEFVISNSQSTGPFNLGLAAGQSPIPLYRKLLQNRMHLPLEKMEFFQLDEFWPLPPHDIKSFAYFLDSHLLEGLGVSKSRKHFILNHKKFSEQAQEADIADITSDYEKLIHSKGGLDLQILGIGVNGHIGFNEPGSSFGSRTRLVSLAESTRERNSAPFGDLASTPHLAITMGLKTILEAKKILMIATGQSKKEAVENCFYKKPNPQWPASCLQNHPDVTVLL